MSCRVFSTVHSVHRVHKNGKNMLYFQVNAVEIPSRGGFSIRAIYPRLAIAAHSCAPNIVHTILTNDYQ